MIKSLPQRRWLLTVPLLLLVLATLVSAQSGIITTVAGTGVPCLPTTAPCGDGGPATSAQLGFPVHLAVDGAGNLYIAEADSHRVRKVDVATGIITPDGQMRVPTQPQQEPAVVAGAPQPAAAAAEPGGIWTPDGGSPAPATQGEQKSKLWVPGMD